MEISPDAAEHLRRGAVVRLRRNGALTFARVLRADPNNGEALFNLGIVLTLIEEFSRLTKPGALIALGTPNAADNCGGVTVTSPTVNSSTSISAVIPSGVAYDSALAVTVAGVSYATTFRVTAGTGANYTTGTTLTGCAGTPAADIGTPAYQYKSGGHGIVLDSAARGPGISITGNVIIGTDGGAIVGNGNQSNVVN